VSETECEVTNYVDWSKLPAETKERTAGRWPIVPVHMLERSVEKLKHLVTRH
jgi:hypothetical protein